MKTCKKVAVMVLVLSLSSLVVSGCVSHAGPFVTNLAAGPNSSLVVERCMAQYSPWREGITTTDCSSSTIALGSAPAPVEAPAVEAVPEGAPAVAGE